MLPISLFSFIITINSKITAAVVAVEASTTQCCGQRNSGCSCSATRRYHSSVGASKIAATVVMLKAGTVLVVESAK